MGLVISGKNISGIASEILVAPLSNSLSVDGNGGSPLVMSGLNYLYADRNDGVTSVWEFERGNYELAIFSSATRSTTVTSALLTNYNARGAVFFLDITGVPGSGSATVSLTIQHRDNIAGGAMNIFTSAQVSAGTTAVMFYPGLSASANGISAVLPRTFSVQANVSSGATSKDVIFSVGMSFIL